MGHNDHQVGRGVSTTTPTLHFRRTTLKEVGSFIKQHHYSHTYPGSIDYCFALDYNGSLAGAAAFGWMAGNKVGMCVLTVCNDPSRYRELMRLVLLDEVPKNSETRFVAWCLRWLRDNTDLLAIVSFADPLQGHTGVIYKAGNWIVCGESTAHDRRIFIDGKEIHPRMVVNRYGTSSRVKLAELGIVAVFREREPKFRFVYVLRPDLREFVKDFGTKRASSKTNYRAAAQTVA